VVPAKIERHLVQRVRLDRENHQVGAVREGEIALDRLAADLLGELIGAGMVDVGEEHRLRRAGFAAGGRPAAGKPAGHVSRAHEAESHRPHSSDGFAIFGGHKHRLRIN
jgi:hypothetical protein